MEGNRTAFPNSFDDNGFGNESDSMRAKIYAFEADLQIIIDAWPVLTEATRAKILRDVQRAMQ